MLFNPFQPSVAFHIETSNLFCFELSISRDQQSIKFFKKTSHIEFKKNKKGLELVYLPHFLHDC